MYIGHTSQKICEYDSKLIWTSNEQKFSLFKYFQKGKKGEDIYYVLITKFHSGTAILLPEKGQKSASRTPVF